MTPKKRAHAPSSTGSSFGTTLAIATASIELDGRCAVAKSCVKKTPYSSGVRCSSVVTRQCRQLAGVGEGSRVSSPCCRRRSSRTSITPRRRRAARAANVALSAVPSSRRRPCPRAATSVFSPVPNPRPPPTSLTAIASRCFSPQLLARALFVVGGLGGEADQKRLALLLAEFGQHVGCGIERRPARRVFLEFWGGRVRRAPIAKRRGAIDEMPASDRGRAAASRTRRPFRSARLRPPAGGSSSVGPSSSVTAAPRAAASRASAIPVAPVDALLTNRTGSKASRVGPAVTTTRSPARSRRARARARAPSTRRSSAASRPTPVSRSAKKSAFPVRRFRIRARAASADSRASRRSSYMAEFIAGAITTGTRAASSAVVSRSSAMPARSWR